MQCLKDVAKESPRHTVTETVTELTRSSVSQTMRCRASIERGAAEEYFSGLRLKANCKQPYQSKLRDELGGADSR